MGGTRKAGIGAQGVTVRGPAPPPALECAQQGARAGNGARHRGSSVQVPVAQSCAGHCGVRRAPGKGKVPNGLSRRAWPVHKSFQVRYLEEESGPCPI